MALRFGLLGTGYWAAEEHGAGLVADPDVDLVGVWGRNPAKAAELAGRLGARAYGDVDTLLADVDAVSIALPPHVQAPLAVRAAEHGCHLLLDKPLALSRTDADQVVAAVESSGVASVVYFTSRFDPAIDAWLHDIAETGGWDGGHGSWLGSIYQPGSPFAESAWRREKGALWDIGPHALSLAIPALGPVERVTAVGGRGDTVHLVLGHAGGASSSLSVSLTVPPAATVTDFSVYGREGSTTMPTRGDGEPYRVALEQLAAGVAAGRIAHPVDVRFAREVTVVLEAAELALREGATRRVV